MNNWYWRINVPDGSLISCQMIKEKVQTCMLLMAMFEPNGPKQFLDVATGDECLISLFTNKTKQFNMVWRLANWRWDTSPEFEDRISLSQSDIYHLLQFTRNFSICLDIMAKGSINTAKYFTDVVLHLVLQYLNTAAGTWTRSRLVLHHDSAGPTRQRWQLHIYKKRK